MYLACDSACIFVELHSLCWIVSGHPGEETENKAEKLFVNSVSIMLRASSATAAGSPPLAYIVQTAQTQLGKFDKVL